MRSGAAAIRNKTETKADDSADQGAQYDVVELPVGKIALLLRLDLYRYIDNRYYPRPLRRLGDKSDQSTRDDTQNQKDHFQIIQRHPSTFSFRPLHETLDGAREFHRTANCLICNEKAALRERGF
jgi:hypothetical protein